MKKKQYKHPRFYIDVKKINSSKIEVSFFDNSFASNGERLILYEELNLVEYDVEYKDLIKYLNDLEYEKLLRYIDLQKKMLKMHRKKNNFDSVNTVQESINIMIDFKKHFIN